MRIFQHAGGIVVFQKSCPALTQLEQQAQGKRTPQASRVVHGSKSTKNCETQTHQIRSRNGFN